MNYYISDTHFDHAKIITLAKRPFSSVDEMNAEMVKRWNERVTKNDVVHFLGDFGWKASTYWYWYNQLNGKIIMYQGNHDKEIPLKYAEITDGVFRLVLFHYPIAAWNGFHKGWYHFYGHVHGQPLDWMSLDWRARSFDVSAEKLDYTPRTAEEIIMAGNS